jgi:spore coat protein CotH
MKSSLFSILFVLAVSQPFIDAQTLKINEFQARNASTLADNNNEYDDWIEIKNPGGVSINLNNYYLTDDFTDKIKCRILAAGSELIISPGGVIILWADNDVNQGTNHLSFKLSGDGGQIGLYSPQVQLIDAVTYINQYTDISQGRDISNNSLWKFYSVPTPGQANTTHGYNGVSGLPLFSQSTGYYSSPLQITISSSQAGESIRYTLDNSDPDNSSLLYQNQVLVNNTRIIRAIAQGTNLINSGIVSHIYFENVQHALPILAIITDSLNLWGSTGIYDHPDHTSSDWERFCQLKYLKDSQLKTESNAGIRIQGNSSVNMPKKSFRLFFKDEYGNGSFDYSIFGSNELNSFKRLVLKAGYDDDITTETGTLLRDALTAELWRQVGYLSNLSAWTSLYLNNRYWGIYNIRESVDEHYIQDHTNMTDFDLIRFNSITNVWRECKYGTIDKWNTMYDYILNSDFSIDENYQEIESMIDMDEFISLMAFVQCSQYYSWGYGISMYRENIPVAKWKICLWDSDRAYSDVDWNGFEDAQNNTGTYFWANHFPKQLINSPIFQQKYSNRINELLNTVFSPENSIHVLDSLYSIISPEMPNELARWNPGNNQWENNVEAIREFLRHRPEILLEQMQAYLPPPTNVNAPILGHSSIDVYPNPFIEQTSIKFYLEKSCPVEIKVFSSAGQLIRNIYNEQATEGYHALYWDGRQINGSVVPAGVYIVSFKTPDNLAFVRIIRMM